MGQLVKAKIMNEDTGESVDVLFNPTEYSFAKENTWETKKLTGNNVPMPSFTGGGVMKMTFQLFFDTYEAATDVREHTEKLLGLMKISEKLKNNDKKAKKGRPPIVSFHWGSTWSFKGVITNLTLKFTLFLEDGTPVRATADMGIQQSTEEGTYPPQNPTSGGEGVRASRVVGPGDTLDLIAFQAYGDSTMWRPLADANGIEDPRTIKPGQRLVIPAL